MAAFQHPHWEFEVSEANLRCLIMQNGSFNESRLEVASSGQTPNCSIRVVESRENNMWKTGATEVFLNNLATAWHIPPPFWRQFWHAMIHTHPFEYFEEIEKPPMPVTKASQQPQSSQELPLQAQSSQNRSPARFKILKAIDFGVQLWIADDNFIRALLRYDIETGHLDAFIWSCEMFQASTVLLDILQSQADALSEHPLLLLAILTGQYVQKLRDLSDRFLYDTCRTEGALGVTADMAFLSREGLVRKFRSYDDENNMLYTQYEKMSLGIRNCQAVVAQSNQFLTIVSEVRSQFAINLPAHEFEVLKTKAQLVQHMFGHLERISETQFTVLYNLILQKDTKLSLEIAQSSKNIATATSEDNLAMKTVAYVTLTFLPVTFISAIFSTTIFDFQKWGETSRVASRGWWIYLLFCLVAIVGTFTVYLIWWRTEKRKMEARIGGA